jgi:hypothetical protein
MGGWCFSTKAGLKALIWSFLIVIPICVGMFLLISNLPAALLLTLGIWLFVHYVTDGLAAIHSWIVYGKKQ